MGRSAPAAASMDSLLPDWYPGGIEVAAGRGDLGGTKEGTAMRFVKLMIATLFWLPAARAQVLRVVPVPLDAVEGASEPLGEIELVCSESYAAESCRLHAAALARELARQPHDGLGRWTFALAPSEGWSELVRSFGGDPRSPAFSVLDRRVTVLEEAIFAPSLPRRLELLGGFGVTGPGLLRLAVAHELGHAVCGELDERRARAYGRRFAAGRAACGAGGDRRSGAERGEDGRVGEERLRESEELAR